MTPVWVSAPGHHADACEWNIRLRIGRGALAALRLAGMEKPIRAAGGSDQANHESRAKV
jgi:hypothetical protein